MAHDPDHRLLGGMAVAEAELAHRVAGIKPEHLDLPSPCDGWSVRDVVNHVIGGAVRYRLLLHAAPEEQIETTRHDDHLGPDAVGSLRVAAAGLAQAASEPGALTRTVAHPAGPISGADLVGKRIIEATVHGWDIAQATDGDTTIPNRLCHLIETHIIGVISGLQGFFAAPLVVPPEATATERLLALVGRRAAP
jgi:uncharacterized protein (TIGR03086 family)